MWLLVFVGVAQASLVGERILNRVMTACVPTRRSETRKLADRMVFSACVAQMWTTVFTLVGIASAAAEVLTRNVSLLVFAMLVMTVLSTVSDSSSFLYVSVYNAYNSGIGHVIHMFAVLPLKILHTTFGSLVPLYNAGLFVAKKTFSYVVFPVVQQEAGLIPALVENVSLFFGAVAISLLDLLTAVLECVGWDVGDDTTAWSAADRAARVAVPYVSSRLQCFANTNYISLDLLTPGIYMRGAVLVAMQMLRNTCVGASSVLDLVLYPLTDYDFYKAVHCAVHAALHVFVGLPVVTYSRCVYGEGQVRTKQDGLAERSAFERAVMCMPDWTPLANILCAMVRSLGTLLDRWLDVALVVVESSVSGEAAAACSASRSVGSVWSAVSGVLGTREALRVVGLTDAMYAVTDGRSTAYFATTGGPRLQYALENWPFEVETSHGIAAVQYADNQDTDIAGQSTTGMFGCACRNTREGMVLSCASVPYQVQNEDSGTHNTSTVHPVRFDRARAPAIMTCEDVAIQVVSLRFSRRRYSHGVGSVDVAAADPHGTNSAARTYLSNTADAAVYVYPRCSVAGAGVDEKCVARSSTNCFPWCMGLHIAGRRNQRIVLRAQEAWENNVNMAQMDCTIDVDDTSCEREGPHATTTLADSDQSYTGTCAFSQAHCANDVGADSFVPSDPELRNVYGAPSPVVRLDSQPFVATGDTFLYRQSGQVTVARLRSSGSSEYMVQRDRLSIDSNALQQPLQECEVRNNDPCYNDAIRENKVVVPASYSFWSSKHSTVAASEWAVHWADTPELSVMTSVWNSCAQKAVLSIDAVSSFGRARVWTVKTTRAKHVMGEETKTSPSVSFMVVPEWISIDPPTACDEIVNVFVVGLEYLNANNLLLTTLACAPRNVRENKVLDMGACEYRYYFVHPNKADCTDPGQLDDERIFSCWRRESVGMFTDAKSGAPDDPHLLCPALERMPNVGSMFAEVAAAAALVLRLFLNVCCVLPPAVATGGLLDLFTQRDAYLYHSVLDTDGALLFKMDDIVAALQLANHHMWNTLGKLSNMLKGTPGHSVTEGVLIGTSRIMEHMDGATPFGYEGLQVFLRATVWKEPAEEQVEELSATATSSPMGNLPTSIGALRQMFVTMCSTQKVSTEAAEKVLVKVVKKSSMKAAAAAKAAWMKTAFDKAKLRVLETITVANAKKAAVTALENTLAGLTDTAVEQALVGTAQAIVDVQTQLAVAQQAQDAATALQGEASAASEAARAKSDKMEALSASTQDSDNVALGMFTSIVFELKSSLENDWLANMRTQCDGLSQIAGYTNPVAQLLRHACLLGPDGIEGMLTAVLVVVVEYPLMHCVCKLPEGQAGAEDTIQSVCLKTWMPVSYTAWTKSLVGTQPDAQQNMCFQSMDSANSKFLTAFDKFQARLFKLTQVVESSLDYLTIVFKEDAGSCEDLFGSAYVMTIMPEPVDYFMQCARTFDCRARCLDTHTAFETAKASLLKPPTFEHQKTVPVESKYFSSSDIEQGLDRPPFEVLRVQELAPEACRAVVCRNTPDHAHQSKCLVAAGVDSVQNVVLAYYCVPLDIAQFVTVYAGLPFADAVPQFARPTGAQLLGLHMLSADRVLSQRRDLVMTLSLDAGTWSLHALESEARTRFLLFATKKWDASAYDESVPLGDQPLQKIDKVWTVAAADTATAYVFVAGPRMVSDGRSAMYAEQQLFKSVRACVRLRVPTGAAAFGVEQVLRDDCSAYVDVVLPRHHTNVCIMHADEQPCSTIIAIPLQTGRAAEVRVTAFDLVAATVATDVMPALTRSGRGLASALELGESMPLYLTQARQAVQTQRRVSSTSYSPVKKAIVFVTGGTRQAWIQNVRLSKTDAGEYQGSRSVATPIEHAVNVSIACSVDNCVGCMPNLLGGSPPNRVFLQLQSKCMAAQQCAIARCVGTTVNMRKPLCNVAKVLAKEMDMVRVGTGGLWLALSRQVILIVELSKRRRKQYEVDFHQEIFNAAVCNTKDALVEVVATVASLFGMITYEMHPGPGSGTRSSKLDTRFHAKSILVLAAATNFITSVAMAPLYMLLAAEKTTSCILNDVVLIVSSMADPGKPAAFLIGSKAQLDATDSTVGICLSEQMAETMREISTKGDQIGGELGLVIGQIFDLIQTMPFEPLQHALDAFFAYLIGVVTGMMDLLQSSDTKHCKLPVVGGGSLNQCVCGDDAVSIPAHIKSDKSSSALWCLGPLLLNSWDGEELLVWNKYSLAELLTLADYDKWLACLDAGGSAGKSCESPTHPDFEAQGVEIMQVIGRCRANYQQSQWDEGAKYLGLFSPEEWAQRLPMTSIAKTSANQRFRLRLRDLRRYMQDPPDARVVQCFEGAIARGDHTPACMQSFFLGAGEMASGVDEHFEYEAARGAQFADIDACRSFSGSFGNADSGYFSVDGAVFPLFMWTGSSANKDPVASRHLVVAKSQPDRLAQARVELDALYAEHIEPFFENMGKMSDLVRVKAYSVEQDELHQFVDCVMLGPYGAADLVTQFPTTLGPPASVPQYYRDSPGTRAFADGTATGGSALRKSVMSAVENHVETTALQAVKDETRFAMQTIRSIFHDKQNFVCVCPDGIARSLQCCVDNGWTSVSQIAFPADKAMQEHWDMRKATLEGILQSVKDTDILRTDVWTDPDYAFRAEHKMSAADRFEMQRIYMFDPEHTVMEYSEAEVLKMSRGGTLWDQCVGLISAAFFTMPVRAGSDPPAVDADMQYDPTQPNGGYRHGMEEAIERILARARKDSPVYWTHVHRYMPSNSQWCEDTTAEPEPLQVPVTSSFSGTGHFSSASGPNVNFQTDTLQQPTLSEVAQVSAMGSRCFCGWQSTDAPPLCAISAAVNCSRVSAALTGELGDAWDTLCTSAKRTYTTRRELFVVMHAFDEAREPTPECVDLYASTVWGLMDRDEQQAWWDGAAATVNVQELATLGPAGLRLGLLGNGADSLHSHVQDQKLVRNTSQSVNYQHGHTIAQPVCKDSASAYLLDDLHEYFKDVLFPMAHTVHESPVAAYCSTWAIEYAIYGALLNAGDAASPAVKQQRAVHELWKERCDVQLAQVGICQLRGVYELEPKAGRDSAAHCAFTVAAGVSDDCADLFYVTPNCLVRCGSSFYDPCLCANGNTCSGFEFDPSVADPKCSPLSFDVRSFTSDEIKLHSMHWPETIPEQEATPVEAGDTTAENATPAHAQLLADVLLAIKEHPSGFHSEALFQAVQLALLEREGHDHSKEGVAPHGFCDDLLDYFDADAQHPVGYHPTCACDSTDTNMRGFDTWMSADAEGMPRVDPVRLRNMTAFSSEFGHSHVLCDAAVYGMPVQSLNPYYLESKWEGAATADAAVPVKPTVNTENYEQLGTNENKDPFDTPLVASAPHGFRHSVGLVRDWFRPLASAGTADAEAVWPQWDMEHTDVYGSDDEAALDNCFSPAQLVCTEDSQCEGVSSATPLVCRIGSSGNGVCMPDTISSITGPDEFSEMQTCFRHEHCADTHMCSGMGLCEAPYMTVRNRFPKKIEVQIFGDECPTPTYGLTQFQGVEDFATANGMCGARNRYEYRQFVENGVSTNSHVGKDGSNSHIYKVKDQTHMWSDSDVEDQTLSQAGVLRAKPHVCDRSYQHSDYGICTGIVAQDEKFEAVNSIESSTYMWAMKTWEKIDGLEYARLCKISDLYPVTGFLSPYQAYMEGKRVPDTLAHVSTTAQPCSRYKLCPGTNFMVEAESVARQVIIASQTVRGSIAVLDQRPAGAFSPSVRRYSNLDADNCYGFGYRINVDIPEEEGTFGKHCVVDRSVVPLLTVIFGSVEIPNVHLPIVLGCTSTTQEYCPSELKERFDSLRKDDRCPKAFGTDATQAKLTFDNSFLLSTRQYKFEDSEKIAEVVNSLLPWMFGISTANDGGRGFSTEEEYVQHANCAEYIIERLYKIQQKTPILKYRRADGNDIEAGLSWYLFQERSAIFIPFRWFWQCVVLAISESEGGAPKHWFEILQNPESVDVEIPCGNFKTGLDHMQLQDHSEVLSVNEMLRVSPHIFLEENTFSVRGDYLDSDITQIIDEALVNLHVTSIPNMQCLEMRNTEVVMNDYQTRMFPLHADRSSDLDFVKSSQNPQNFITVEDDQILEDIIQELSKAANSVDNEVNYPSQWQEKFPTSSNLVTAFRVLTINELRKLGILVDRNLQETMVRIDSKSVPVFNFLLFQRAEGVDKLTIPPPIPIKFDGTSFFTETDGGTKTNYATVSAACYPENAVQGSTYFKLVKPEYEVFADAKAITFIPEKLTGERLYNLQKYYTREEVVYLVLRYMEAFMGSKASMTAGKLIAIESHSVQHAMQSGVQDSGRYLTDASKQLNMASFRVFNMEMRQKAFECDENAEINYNDITNNAFEELGQCAMTLQEKVGWSLASGRKLHFPLTKGMLLDGMYPSFSEHVPLLGGEFVDNMTSAKWGKTDYRGRNAHSQCFISGRTRVEVMNPMLNGDFDMTSGCETTQVEGNLWMIQGCDSECAQKAPGWDKFLTTSISETCRTRENELVSRFNKFYKPYLTPICNMRFLPSSVCGRAHGTLDANQGEPVTDLYAATPVQSMQGGLWAEGNMNGGHRQPNVNTSARDIRVLASDIGGHALYFEVTPSGSLQLRYLHMGRFDGPLIVDVHDWMPNIRERWKTLHTRYRPVDVFEHLLLQKVSWRCPLQRLGALYHTHRPAYELRYPSAMRNRVMFAHITAPLDLAHVTVASSKGVDFLKSGRFMSEYFACTAQNQADCQRAVGSSVPDTALQQTLLALRASSHTEVQWIPGNTVPCTTMLDWPLQPVHLVDHSLSSNGAEIPEFCNVYDRTPAFSLLPGKLSYPRSPLSSNSVNGVCRMGRLRRIGEADGGSQAFAIQHCNSSDTSVRCVVLAGGTRKETRFAFVPPHKPSRKVTRRDRRCSSCDSHDTTGFVDRAGTTTPMQAKPLSVGQPVKLSTARIVAAHIRRVLCGGNATCPALERVTATPAGNWRRNTVLRDILVPPDTVEEPSPPDDSMLWARSWVWCEKGETCAGSVSKADWLDADRRTDACARVVLQESTSAGMPVHFCLIDDTTEAICRKVVEWNSEITFIICRALGFAECQDDGYFYAPTTYSVSNGEFVHDTVQEFYSGLDSSRCAVTLSDAQNEQKMSNEALKHKCASSALVPLREALYLMRGIKTLLVELYFYAAGAFSQLGLLVVYMLGKFENRMALIDAASDKILQYIELFILQIIEIMSELARVIFTVIFGQGFPKKIVTILETLCAFTNWVNREIVGKSTTDGVLCTVFNWLGDIYGVLADVLQTVMKVSFLGISPFNGLLTLPFKALTFISEAFKNALPCNEDNQMQCDFSDEYDDDSTLGELPVATRCFSTYSTYFGEGMQLSCSAADTCNGNLAGTADLEVCGSCPTSPGTNRFSCSPVTKICTCNVPVLGRTLCHANEDCYTSDSSCLYLDDEFKPGWGSVPCTLCDSAKMCFLQDGETTGQCACGLNRVNFASCNPDDKGKTVVLKVDDMCLHTRDVHFSITNAFTQSYDNMLAVPCARVNPASTYCTVVTDRPGLAFMVSANVLGSGRRRLLALDGLTSNMTHSAVCKDALESTAMPAMRQACVDAYHYSIETAGLLQMPGELPECMFCSVADFMAAVLRNPLLIPVLGVHPSRLVRIVMRHTPFRHVAESFAALRVMVRVLKMDMDANESSPVLRDMLTFADRHISSVPNRTEARQLLSASDAIVAGGAEFVSKFGEMLRAHDDYTAVFSSYWDYDVKTHYTTELWNRNVFKPAAAGVACPPLLELLEFVQSVAADTRAYYQQPSPAPPPQSLRDAWPVVTRSADPVTQAAPDWDNTLDVVSASATWAMRRLASTVGLTTHLVHDIITSMVREAQLAMVCDLRAVQTCSAWTVRLQDGVLVVTLYTVLAGFVLSVLNLSPLMYITLMAVEMFVLFPTAVMYICYGYSPFCWPLLPTCMIADVYSMIEEVFPRVLTVPYVMYARTVSTPARLEACNVLLRVDCLTPCSDEPFDYNDWQDILAWGAAELDVGAVDAAVQSVASIGLLPQMAKKAQTKRNVYLFADASTISANRICAFTNAYKAIPVLLCVLLGASMVFAVVRILMTFVYATVAIFASLAVSIFTQ